MKATVRRLLSPLLLAALLSAVSLCSPLLMGCGNSQPAGNTEATGSEQAEPEPAQAETEQEPEETHPTLSLEDPSDRAAINDFLTYFTMSFDPAIAPVSFVSGDASDQELTHFAVTLLGLNSYDGWEDALDDAVEIDDGLLANIRIDADKINELVREYFGREIDFANYSYSPDMHYYEYSDGYIYFFNTAPVGQVAYYGCATSLEDLGEGTYRIAFSGLTELDYNKWDSHLAGCTYEEMCSELGISGPYCEGEVVVNVTEDADGKHLTLSSINMRRVDEIEEEAPAEAVASGADRVSGWFYAGCITAMGDGEPSVTYPEITGAEVEGDTITLYGTLVSSDTREGLDSVDYSVDVFGPDTWTFEISPDAQFEGAGGVDEDDNIMFHTYDRESFLDGVQNCNGLGLEFHVTDGVLDYACFWS